MLWSSITKPDLLAYNYAGATPRRELASDRLCAGLVTLLHSVYQSVDLGEQVKVDFVNVAERGYIFESAICS